MDFVLNDILEVATAFATLDVDARVQLEETIVTALATRGPRSDGSPTGSPTSTPCTASSSNSSSSC